MMKHFSISRNHSNPKRRKVSTRVTELANVELQIGPAGHWLLVRTTDGRTAGCCLENLHIGYGAEEVFVQWADEQKFQHTRKAD